MTRQVPVDSSYHYPGEEITWAGECPFTGGLSFGTESGGVLVPLPNESDGEAENSETGEAAWLVEDMGDVVNGVAFGDSFCAASTPSHVAIIDLETGKVVQTLSRGAHDVLSLDGNRFLASAGRAGLISIDVHDRQVHVREFPVRGNGLYFYSANLVARENKEFLVACAARQGGLAYANILQSTDQIRISAHKFPDLDVVSAVGILLDDYPRAVVALTIDGSLLVSRDVLIERPSVIHFEMPGRAYTLRSVGPHLAVLTSEAIHIVRDFARILPQLVEGACSGVHTAIADVHASEIYAAFDRYLLAEIDDGISVVDMNDIFTSASKTFPSGAQHTIRPSRGSSLWGAGTCKSKGAVKSVSLPVAPSFTFSEMTAINS